MPKKKLPQKVRCGAYTARLGTREIRSAKTYNRNQYKNRLRKEAM